MSYSPGNNKDLNPALIKTDLAPKPAVQEVASPTPTKSAAQWFALIAKVPKQGGVL